MGRHCRPTTSVVILTLLYRLTLLADNDKPCSMDADTRLTSSADKVLGTMLVVGDDS